MVDDWAEITTPYLDRHNDRVQIFARKVRDGFELTDDGYTIRDLRSTGCDLDTPHRQDMLKLTLSGFGVTLSSTDELTIRASIGNFPQQKHNLVQAVISVNDLFVLARPNVQTLFTEDVEQWLWNASIRYTPRVRFIGKSGLEHQFDFVIPATPNKAPERFVQAVNRPSKENAELFVFKWEDIRDNCGRESQAFAILNDYEQRPSQAVTNALRNYNVQAVPFSERETVTEALAA